MTILRVGRRRVYESHGLCVEHNVEKSILKGVGGDGGRRGKVGGGFSNDRESRKLVTR